VATTAATVVSVARRIRSTPSAFKAFSLNGPIADEDQLAAEVAESLLAEKFRGDDVTAEGLKNKIVSTLRRRDSCVSGESEFGETVL